MGAKLCTLRNPISCQKSKSSFKKGIQHKCVKIENQKKLTKNFERNIDMETPEKKNPMPRKLTLYDWILASPSMKPEYLMRGELCVHSMKKVHPCSGQFVGSLISETKDSLCLDRPINHDEESEDMSNCSLICKSLSGKSRRSVRFKLPHTVIYYTPEQTYYKKASLCSPKEQKPYKGESECEGSFSRENSFESSADEPVFKLAVDILPHVSVSSKI